MFLINIIAFVIAMIGCINWGLIGIFNWNLVSAIFGTLTVLSSIVYILVLLSAIWLILVLISNKGSFSVRDRDSKM